MSGQDKVGTVGHRAKILMTVARVRIASQRATEKVVTEEQSKSRRSILEGTSRETK
jgi:hypothetical protein